MKIYYRNKAAKLKRNSLIRTCARCPFYTDVSCPFETFTIVDCVDKGWWVDGESIDIFEL